MYKAKKKEYYKHAISIHEFDYAKEHYREEWGISW